MDMRKEFVLPLQLLQSPWRVTRFDAAHACKLCVSDSPVTFVELVMTLRLLQSQRLSEPQVWCSAMSLPVRVTLNPPSRPSVWSYTKGLADAHAKYQARQPPISGLNIPNRDTVNMLRGKRVGLQKPPRQLKEDNLSSERVLTGSLAVGRNWDPEEILRYQV